MSPQTPGVLAYLPPEAQDGMPSYTVAVDAFSFGQLALYTLVQEFPNPSAPTFVELGIVLARSESQRRERYFSQLLTIVPNSSVTVAHLVDHCLQNDPGQRPSTQQILHQLKADWVVPDDLYQEMTKMELVVSMRVIQVCFSLQ